MRNGDLADHRLAPRFEIDILRQAMEIRAVARLLAVAKAFRLNICRRGNNREGKNNCC
jgi:hypothetical protein